MLKRAWIPVLVSLCSVAFAQISAADRAKELGELSTLKRQWVATKAKYAKKPTNKKLRDAYVFETVRLGMRTLYSPALNHKTQSDEALIYFREALKLDPKNIDAKKAAAQIEATKKLIQSKKPKG